MLRRIPSRSAAATGEGAAESNASRKKPAEFRDHEGTVRPSVREFYRLNHTYQSVEFVRQKQVEYLPLAKRK